MQMSEQDIDLTEKIARTIKNEARCKKKLKVPEKMVSWIP